MKTIALYAVNHSFVSHKSMACSIQSYGFYLNGWLFLFSKQPFCSSSWGLQHNWLLPSAVYGIYIVQTKISIFIPTRNLLCHDFIEKLNVIS